MRSINVLSINGEAENERDLIKTVRDAIRYFPKEAWDDIRYIGKIRLEHDIRLATCERSFGAFLFEKLVERVGKMKGSDEVMNLLLGITLDPIAAMYYCFDGTNFKRSLYFIHDYVGVKVGVVSFFRVKEESSGKVVAHGLGHNKGLHHHTEPIDLIYSELLRFPRLQVEGFCEACMHKLKKS